MATKEKTRAGRWFFGRSGQPGRRRHLRPLRQALAPEGFNPARNRARGRREYRGNSRITAIRNPSRILRFGAEKPSSRSAPSRPCTIVNWEDFIDKMTGVVRLLQIEKDRLTKKLHGVTAALAAFGKEYAKGTGTRKLSASARAKIAAAQRARWAKVRANSGTKGKAAP